MKSVTKYIRISPKKANLVAQMVRRKPVGEAMDILMQNGKAVPNFLMAFKRSLAMLVNIRENINSDALGIIFQEAYTNNLSELLWSDNSPSGSANFWSLLHGFIVRGEASRWEYDALIKPWATKIFTYQNNFKAHEDNPSCWSGADNYYEPLRSCPYKIWRYFSQF